MSLPDFSGNESHAWWLSAGDSSFQKVQTILELVEEVDMLYLSHPGIKLVRVVWRYGEHKFEQLSYGACVVHKASKQVISRRRKDENGYKNEKRSIKAYNSAVFTFELQI